MSDKGLKLANVKISCDGNKLINRIIVNGIDLSEVTNSVNIKIRAGEVPMIYLGIYVDDLILTGDCATQEIKDGE